MGSILINNSISALNNRKKLAIMNTFFVGWVEIIFALFKNLPNTRQWVSPDRGLWYLAYLEIELFQALSELL